nr:hypothetical transcript [Hymenolepis microstoma]
MIATVALFYLMAIHFSDAKVNICQMPIDSGKCNGKLIFWGFDYPSRKCRPFVYGGCGGNGNRFITKDQCERVCLRG